MDEEAQDGLVQAIKATWKEDTTRGWLWWDTKNKWKNNNRLHSRWGYRWVRPCHEIITRYFSDDEVMIDYDLTVYHKPDDTKSRSQYLPMLEMAVKEDDKDFRMWVYLTREYFFHQKWEKVITTAEKVLSMKGWNIERASTCRAAGQSYYKLGNIEKAQELFTRGVQEAPDQLESWFSLAQFCYEIKNWQGCWDSAVKVNELKKQNHYLSEDSIWRWRCFDLLAISGWYLNKKEEAIEYAKKAVDGNSNDKRLKDNLEWMQKNNANI